MGGMGNIVLVVVGMFVLVWIISAVMKATQAANPKPPARPLPPPNRNRPNNQQQPPAEKTTNSDLERFMAEIDKLRTGGPKPPAPQPKANPQPQRANQLAAGRPQPNRTRANNRKANVPPPVPKTPELPPVLRPIEPVAPPATTAATSHTLAGFKQAKLARTAASGGGTERDSVSPVLQTIQQILRTNQGPAVALVLKEIFGEPRCRQRHGTES